jgi:hypothetical protein
MRFEEKTMVESSLACAEDVQDQTSCLLLRGAVQRHLVAEFRGRNACLQGTCLLAWVVLSSGGLLEKLKLNLGGKEEAHTF